MSTAVWWIRRGLRLTDNQALAEALKDGTQVVPLFIVDPNLVKSRNAGEVRLAFLWEALRQLAASLEERGSRLIVRHGDPQSVLPELVESLGETAVFAEEDYSPYAQHRDRQLAEKISLTLTPGVTIHHPETVHKQDGDPYVVYTPYKRTWNERPLPKENQLIKVPDQINTPADLESEPIPDSPRLPDNIPFPPSEKEAQKRLKQFTEGQDAPIFSYATERDFPAIDGTARLSPYLRLGLISCRQAMVTAVAARQRASNKEAQAGAQTWLDELIWREFYLSILYHFPHVSKGNFREDYDNLQWENDEDQFEKWCQGQTGYPIVDAAMRQLKHSGWMHNRSRMIVASFLVKDLLIDWRWGERWFMQHLVDGDPAANNGGWQWAAGTGTDAAPYFRIFNPTTQGEKYDSEGKYIRKWVPELADVPDKFIHEPSKMSAAQQKKHNCHIGEDYPAPIVNHKEARQRTLEAYKAAKNS